MTHQHRHDERPITVELVGGPLDGEEVRGYPCILDHGFNLPSTDVDDPERWNLALARWLRDGEVAAGFHLESWTWDGTRTVAGRPRFRLAGAYLHLEEWKP